MRQPAARIRSGEPASLARSDSGTCWWAVQQDVYAIVAEQPSHRNVIREVVKRMMNEADAVAVQALLTTAHVRFDLLLSDDDASLVLKYDPIVRLIRTAQPCRVQSTIWMGTSMSSKVLTASVSQ